MARIDNLNNFLTDVADSIREKKGTTELIPASAFDTEIDSISGGVDINDYYLTTGTNDKNINYYIKKIPTIDTSNLTSLQGMFEGCNNLMELPAMNTSKVQNMSSMLRHCSKLTTIPQLDTSNVTSMYYMFGNCSSLTTIPQLDTSNVTNMNSMVSNCTSLTTIPQLSTGNVTDLGYMFYMCENLILIPQLDTSNVIDIKNMFLSCYALTTLGGFQNLGMAYDISKSANYRNYTLDLSASSKLTHDSLINVINGLYDIKSKGCNPQQLVLGSTNISKLSAEELQICTERGWSVS